jgi:hypothetical protein
VVPRDAHHVVGAEGLSVQHDRGVFDHDPNVNT